MKEITVRIYDYEELSPDARKRALEEWRSEEAGPLRECEVEDTLGRLQEELGIEVTRWRYSLYGHDSGVVRFLRYTDDQLALSGRRAQAFLWNNFAHLIVQPRKKWYSKNRDGRIDLSGRLHCGDGWKNMHRESKIFFDRTYDGTCPLTGVFFDNDALDPLACFCFGVTWSEDEKKRVMVPHDERRRWKSKTVEEVIRECVDALFESAQKDCEYQDSEEHFAEMCRDNGWTFEENGERRDAT